MSKEKPIFLHENSEAALTLLLLVIEQLNGLVKRILKEGHNPCWQALKMTIYGQKNQLEWLLNIIEFHEDEEYEHVRK